MPGLVPGIHVFLCSQENKTWMAGTSPAMTKALVTLEDRSYSCLGLNFPRE
jgi:hypothetical protein